jgi:putative DNA methylase
MAGEPRPSHPRLIPHCQSARGTRATRRVSSAFDPETRWALAWFEEHGTEEGLYGVAESLSKAKNTAVSGLVEAGILEARSGKVRLLPREKLPASWDPQTDDRLTVWEVTQHMIRTLNERGEERASRLLRKVGATGEGARDLAYRLYSICERKKWAQEALAYNGLVISWPEISRLAAAAPSGQEMLLDLEVPTPASPGHGRPLAAASRSRHRRTRQTHYGN